MTCGSSLPFTRPLLRIDDEDAKAREYEHHVADLRTCVDALGATAK